MEQQDACAVRSFSQALFSERLVCAMHCTRIEQGAQCLSQAAQSLVGKADSKEYACEQEKHHSNGHGAENTNCRGSLRRRHLGGGVASKKEPAMGCQGKEDLIRGTTTVQSPGGRNSRRVIATKGRTWGWGQWDEMGEASMA